MLDKSFRSNCTKLGALALCSAAFELSLMPDTPHIEPDSQGYLDFAPHRTAAYPLILEAIGPATAVYFQPIVHVLALLYLGLEIAKTFNTWVPACAIMIFSLFSHELTLFHGSILTESLYSTSIVVLLGRLVRYLRRPELAVAISIGLVAGISATIRPSGSALLPMLGLAPLLTGVGLRRIVLLVIASTLPMLLIIGIERAYTHTLFGPATTSLAGQHLFAKAALIDARRNENIDLEQNPAKRVLDETIRTSLAPVRGLLNKSPDIDVRTILTPDYEGCIQRACLRTIRQKLKQAHGLSDSEINQLMLEVGVSRLSANLDEYLKLARIHYLGMIYEFIGYHPFEFSVYRGFIAENRPLPFEDQVIDLIPPEVKPNSHYKVRAFRPPKFWPSLAMLLTSALALFGLASAFRRGTPSKPLGMAILAAWVFHANLLFTAMFGLGISRYLTVVWPAMVTSLVFASLWFWGVFLTPRLNANLDKFPHPFRKVLES